MMSKYYIIAANGTFSVTKKRNLTIYNSDVDRNSRLGCFNHFGNCYLLLEEKSERQGDESGDGNILIFSEFCNINL